MANRLRRLEERAAASGRCPECVGGAGIVVAYDAAASRKALDERCSQCGRALTIIKVIYEDAPEGEGGLLD
jgi:hypothetical protein